MNLLEAGKHLAKAVDHCISSSEKGEPFLSVLFELEDGHKMMWRGSLTHEKGKEITVRTLKTLGFAGTVKDLARGAESGCLDMDKTVELDIQIEEYNGKKFLKIQWVNEVGGGGFKNRLSEIEAVQACAGLDLEAAFMQAGIKTSSVTRHNPVAQKKDLDLDSIPF